MDGLCCIDGITESVRAARISIFFTDGFTFDKYLHCFAVESSEDGDQEERRGCQQFCASWCHLFITRVRFNTVIP